MQNKKNFLNFLSDCSLFIYVIEVELDCFYFSDILPYHYVLI